MAGGLSSNRREEIIKNRGFESPSNCFGGWNAIVINVALPETSTEVEVGFDGC